MNGRRKTKNLHITGSQSRLLFIIYHAKNTINLFAWISDKENINDKKWREHNEWYKSNLWLQGS
jgi:hypothetical protein